MSEFYDPDQMRSFTTEDNFQPGAVLGELKKKVSELRHLTDLITNSRAMRVSDNRGQIGDDLLKAYETTMLAYGDVKQIGRLSNDQQREILVMVDDILRGKREYVHLQLTRNCDGIKELFTNKTYLISKQDKK